MSRIGDRIYFFGGNDGSGATNLFSRYDPFSVDHHPCNPTDHWYEFMFS